MSRNRRSARQAGARFERTVADYLAATIDDRIDRRVKTGAKDRGDIGGLRLSPALRSQRVVCELKDTTRTAICRDGRARPRQSDSTTPPPVW